MATIAVVGATGHTGRFIVREAARRGHTAIAIGRDETALRGIADLAPLARRATLEDAAALDRALAGVDAVVNAAGPFLDTATAVVDAALRTGIHYVDVTAEQASARATLEDYADAARRRGIAVVPAVAFYGGLADVCATYATRAWPSIDRIEIAIALDRWWPTPGTRATGRRNTVPRVVVVDGRLQAPPHDDVASWHFTGPFATQAVTAAPLTEQILIARHLPVRDVRTYLATAPLADLADPATPPPAASDASGRSAQRFALDVRARRGAAERRIVVSGRDIYAMTAPIVLETVERLVAGANAPAGAFALGQIVDPADFLRALRDTAELAITTDGELAAGPQGASCGRS